MMPLRQGFKCGSHRQRLDRPVILAKLNPGIASGADPPNRAPGYDAGTGTLFECLGLKRPEQGQGRIIDIRAEHIAKRMTFRKINLKRLATDRLQLRFHSVHPCGICKCGPHPETGQYQGQGKAMAHWTYPRAKRLDRVFAT